MNRANRHRVIIGSVVAHHAHALDRKQNPERLPDAAVQSGFLDLGHENIVGLLQQAHALARHFAHDAHAKTGPGERLAPDHFFRQSEFGSHPPHFILEQLAKRFDKLQVHAFRQTAHVVMRLYRLGWSLHRHGLDHIRVHRSLYEVVHLTHQCGFFLEDLDELAADDLSFLLRIGNAGKQIKEAVGGLDAADVEMKIVLKDRENLLELVFPQQAVIDEKAGQAIPDRL